jgi:hypothetical protein
LLGDEDPAGKCLPAPTRINASYVSRVLRLTLLAPDIVEAILDGRQAPETTLRVLMGPFPVEWDRLRATLIGCLPGYQNKLSGNGDLSSSRAIAGDWYFPGRRLTPWARIPHACNWCDRGNPSQWRGRTISWRPTT